MKKFACVAVFAVLLFSGSAFSQSLFTYEGKLYSAQGVPYTGQAHLTFRIYNSDTGGTPLWEETQVVDVLNGNFSAVLGYSMPLTTVDFSQSPLYLAVEVNNDGEMTPRILLTDVPGAIKAKYAENVEVVAFKTLCNGWAGKCKNIDPNGEAPTPLTTYQSDAYITITNPDNYTGLYLVTWQVMVKNESDTDSNPWSVFWFITTVDDNAVSPTVYCSHYHPTGEFEVCPITIPISISPGTHKVSAKIGTGGAVFSIYQFAGRIVRIK